MDLKEHGPLYLAKGRRSLAFICFLIIFPAEGAFMRGTYSEPPSAQTISDNDTNQYVPVVHSNHGTSQTVVHFDHSDVPVFNEEKNDGKHSIETTAATSMETGEVNNRKLLKPREPRKAKPDVGQQAKHN